ncbi:hypothetical protein [Aestuariivirga sp.]|uniref:hypothetical protein n=1 Tax=Aestuariivirga sp. TaxID=2650926 RepID=UPI0039E36597
MRRRREEMLAQVREEKDVYAKRLTIAQEFIKMLRDGYHALLHHQVDYTKLREFQEPIDITNVTTPAEQQKAMSWLTKVRSAIRAAVLRSGFTVH